MKAYKVIKLFLIALLLIVSSCSLSKKIIAKKYYIGSGLTMIPDSILRNHQTTELDFSPSWTIIGHFGDAYAETKNNLSVLPNELCKMKMLRKLNLSYNDIRELPNCFCQLQNLEYLDLSYNDNLNITQALPLLKQLKQLKSLNLFGIKKILFDSSKIKSEFQNSVQIIVTKYDFDKWIEQFYYDK